MLKSFWLFTLFTTTALAAVSQPSALPHSVTFEENRGQAPPKITWMGRGASYQLFLDSDGASIVVPSPSRKGVPKPVPATPAKPNPTAEIISRAHLSVVRMNLEGGHRWNSVTGLQPTGGVSNYLLGNDPKRWHTGIGQYARLRVADVYDNIDLVFHGNNGDLEYDFVLAAGADPNEISLGFEGVNQLRVDRTTGDLLLSTPGGAELRQARPKVYQEAANGRVEVEGGYLVKDPRHVGFRLGSYDRRKPLVIDPTVLFTVFLEGNKDDVVTGIAVDSAGYSYITGYTTSSDFPASYQIEPFSKNCTVDLNELICPPTAFVTKFTPQTGQILFSTYIGGSGLDEPRAIAVGSDGIFVTGYTGSLDFARGKYGFGNGDAFVVKLTLSGQAYLYETSFGGVDVDAGNAIAIDAANCAYVTGITYSVDFPTSKYFSQTLNPFQKAFGGFRDAFVVKLDYYGYLLDNGNSYSTYLGGSDFDQGLGIAVDSTGYAYVTGVTWSNNFPTASTLSHGFPSSGGSTAFVTKLFPNGSGVVFSIYLGGTQDVSNPPPLDGGTAIVLGGAGTAYITGSTCSRNFPTTAGAFQTSQPAPCINNNGLSVGSPSAFVSKMSGVGQLLQSTYLGGNLGGDASSVGVNGLGQVYVAGDTASTNFPGAPPINPNPTAGYLTKLRPNLSGIFYTKYLGASINGIRVFEPNSRVARLFTTIYTAGARFRPGDLTNRDIFVVKLSDLNLTFPF